MRRTLLWALLAMLPVSAPAQGIQAESESEQTRLDRSEIADLIARAGGMTAGLQQERIDRIWLSGDDSATPRSDFLFCTAMAYLGHQKAQACLARAFEQGCGIVGDYTDAYVWYTIARENAAGDPGLLKEVESGRARVEQTLLSVYPAPSASDLEDAVSQKKEQIREAASEAGS